jgi:hypothetical protein
LQLPSASDASERETPISEDTAEQHAADRHIGEPAPTRPPIPLQDSGIVVNATAVFIGSVIRRAQKM